MTFTHTQEMPWMLPGVAPTNRYVEVALVAIVRFRNGRLAHEHIYWDQASVLKQIGLLKDPGLRFRSGIGPQGARWRVTGVHWVLPRDSRSAHPQPCTRVAPMVA